MATNWLELTNPEEHRILENFTNKARKIMKIYIGNENKNTKFLLTTIFH